MYLCAALSVEGACLSWIPFQHPEVITDFSFLNEAFVWGFGTIFGLWIIGLAASVAVRLVRLA